MKIKHKILRGIGTAATGGDHWYGIKSGDDSGGYLKYGKGSVQGSGYGDDTGHSYGLDRVYVFNYGRGDGDNNGYGDNTG